MLTFFIFRFLLASRTICIVEFQHRTSPATIRQKSRNNQADQETKSSAPTDAAPSVSAVPGQATVVLVFSSVEYSQEELRAKLPRYAYDEAKFRRQLSQLDSDIESRLTGLTGRH